MNQTRQRLPDDTNDAFSASITPTLRREVGILYRSRRLIGSCVALCLLMAAAYNYGTRPLYEAFSVISMDEAGVSPLKVRGSVDETRRAAALDGRVLSLKSQEMALAAVTEIEPLVVSELAKGPIGDWEDRIKEEVLVRLGLGTKHGSSPREQVEAFRSRLLVYYEPPSPWVYVRFTAYDPKAAALAAQRLVSVFLAETEKETAGAAGASRQRMAEKVAERKDRAAQTKEKLEEFEKRQGLLGADARRGLLDKELARLQDSLIGARQTRLTRRALLEEVQQLSPAGMLTIQTIREDREISEASGRMADLEARIARDNASLGDLHPEILGLRSELELARGRIETRLGAIRDAMKRDYRIAEREEAETRGAVEAAQRNLASLGKSALEHSFIQKQAEAGQRAVGELIDRSVRESDEEVFFAPKLLQVAEAPSEPSSPQRVRNFQYALVIGLGLGLLLAWLNWHLDETVKTPEDIKAGIGLPLLTMVPRVASSRFDLFGPEQGVTAALFESYRVLRTNLMIGDPTRRPHPFILMTSSREGEGKTTTSCGLAVAMANAGLRILLVDGDLRRASLSRLLSATDRLGLADAIDGSPAEACITETSVPGLRLMPCGLPRPNPAEMLNRESLMHTVESVRAQYDWIICDAPPVLAVADAAILCRVADEVLVVVGANSTPLSSIRVGIDQLVAVGANVRGLVLNRVDLNRDSHYYRYYYSAHYTDYSGRRTQEAPR